MRSYQVPNLFSSPPSSQYLFSIAPHFDSIMLWQISPPLSFISGPKGRNSALQNRTFLFWGASIVSFFLSDESIKLAHCKTKKGLNFTYLWAYKMSEVARGWTQAVGVKTKPTINAHFIIAKGLHLLKRNWKCPFYNCCLKKVVRVDWVKLVVFYHVPCIIGIKVGKKKLTCLFIVSGEDLVIYSMSI
jgi:hypothetical protein